MIKSLDQIFRESCYPEYSEYIHLEPDIVKIPNFFKNFNKARNFFLDLDKWETNFLDFHNKPGINSLLPSWFVTVFLEKYFKENKIISYINSYNAVCNYFYHDKNNIQYQNKSIFLPHYDFDFTHDFDLKKNGYVCLVNLNNVDVTTRFWSFNKEKKILGFEQKENFLNFLNNEMKKSFLDLDKNKVPKELEIVNEITYNPNEAIIYYGNLLHSPKIDSLFTKENPRILLRMSYVVEM